MDKEQIRTELRFKTTRTHLMNILGEEFLNVLKSMVPRAVLIMLIEF